MPVLEPKTDQHDEPTSCGIENNFFYLINESTTCLYSFSCSDSIRSIFFVTDQTSNDHRSLTIELDPMYLIEKDNNNEDYFEKMKYSNIKLEIDNQRLVDLKDKLMNNFILLILVIKIRWNLVLKNEEMKLNDEFIYLIQYKIDK